MCLEVLNFILFSSHSQSGHHSAGPAQNTDSPDSESKNQTGALGQETEVGGFLFYCSSHKSQITEPVFHFIGLF